MLRSACFKNFVKFKDHQTMDFRDGGPFICIGEHESGKSSVQEGIRRCLTKRFNNSVSSAFDPKHMSYFICDFELCSPDKGNIVCGIVVLPKESEETEEETKSYFKFAMKYSDDSEDDTMYGILVEKTGETKEVKVIDSSHLRSQFTDLVYNQTIVDTKIEENLRSCFSIGNTETSGSDYCEAMLAALTKNVVFTLSLRSVGLQWSESLLIEDREKRYAEAESRSEIIKYFLEDKDETKFCKEREQKYFIQITQSHNYNFDLKENKVILRDKQHGLRKCPEGIFEAKVFSILMSSKTYRTLFLEEPGMGMHPQYIERMLHIMERYKHEKRIILTTHNTTFVNPWTIPHCFVFSCQGEESHIISGKSIVRNDKKSRAQPAENANTASDPSAENADTANDPSAETTNMKELRLLTSDHVVDILFAKKVLFYEGDSEMLFLTELKHQILAEETKVKGVFQGDENAYDELKQTLIELTFINMNGKANYFFYKEMCDKLKLKQIFLLDKDSVLPIMIKDKSKPERIREIEAKEIRTPEKWRAIREDFLRNRRIFFWLDGEIEDMLNEMSESDNNLLEGLKRQNVTFQRGKGKNDKEGKRPKLFLQHGIKSIHVRDSVNLILNNCKPEHDLAEFLKFLPSLFKNK